MKAEGCRGLDRGIITARVLLLVLVVMMAMVKVAEASGTPTQLIVFTDKKVYFDAGINPRTTAADGFHPDPSWVEAENLTAITYAIVLDDDGNIIHGTNGSINATINDVKILSHANAASRNTTTHHSNIINNPNYVFISVPTFNDNGATYDNYANDGINSAILDIPDFTLADPFTWNGSAFSYSDAHILLQINVTYTGSVTLTGNVTIMISPMNCHQGDKDSHADFNAHHADENADMMTCTNCHWGYDHLYNGDKFDEIPSEFDDVHINRIVLPSGLNSIGMSPSGVGFDYNTSYDEGTAWGTWGTYEPKEFNASKYCYVCHYATNGGGLLEYGGVESAKRSNLNDRPSCSVASKSLGAGTVTCHTVTNITGTTIIDWSNSMATAVTTTNNLLNVTRAVSHNHSTSRPANVSCALCHGTVHNFKLPNSSATGSAYLEINNQCVLCHNIAGGLNITSNGGSNIDHSSTDCRSCHQNDTGVLDAHLIPVAGGPDCISCHDYGKTASQRINNSAMNSSNASHANLNKNAKNTTDVPAENSKCWGCHTNNGSQPGNTSMGNRYDDPYKCYDCHNSTGKPYANVSTALNVSEHFKNGSQIRAASSASDNSSSCTVCHNQSELKIRYTEDDTYNSEYSLSSHYTRNRTDLRSWNGTAAVNCTYCHQNTSTAFSVAMLDPSYNRSIQNHTQSNSPACYNSTCHNSSWLHNSTLKKPAVNSTLCTSCHIAQAKHNNSIQCSGCHLQTNRSIHPVQYLQQDGSTFKVYGTANKTSAINCTNCHQTRLNNFSSAPLIPNPLKHSSNLSNGSIWNSTTYWTSANASCYYCHNNTKHNATAMGRVSTLMNDPNNTRNGSLATTMYCADCHYNDSANAYYNGSRWDPVPPLITVDNTGRSNWVDHSTYFTSGYRDENCRICHALNGSSLATSQNYSHSLDEGKGGGPNCILCHNLVTGLSGGAPVGINFTAANASSHNGTNTNNATMQGYIPIIGACWACHDTDGNVTSGHPDKYKNPKKCNDCHLVSGTYYSQSQTWGGLTVAEHYYKGTDITAGNSSSNISSCINCHENISEMLLYNADNDTGGFTGDGVRLTGGNMSFYHYGRNRTDIRTWNGSSAVNCSYCHQNASTAFASAMFDPSYNHSIGNHSDYSSNPTCIATQCHNSGWIHNSTLTRLPLTPENSTFCLACHGNNGSGGTNYTGMVTGAREKHNNSVNCTECHLNASRDVHPVKYLLQNATYSTGSSTAVTCITCHQTTGVDSNLTLAPPKINSPLNHSDNATNGSIWNSTAYWTSPLTACTYCHNDTKHNATALGRPAYWKGNNIVNSSINTGTWCSSCHWRGYSSGGKNYSDMTSTFTSANLSVPPEITNGTYARYIYNRSDYYNHSLTNYNDATCKLCHGIDLSSNITITELMHNITGNTCTDCHYSFEAMNNTTQPDRYVDLSMYGTSQHSSLDCTGCHTKGHRNIGARKACEDCHAVQQNPLTDRDRHNITATPATYYFGNVSVVNITDCTLCHSSTLYNTSIATYGYWKPKDCDYCHTYPDKYYE